MSCIRPNPLRQGERGRAVDVAVIVIRRLREKIVDVLQMELAYRAVMPPKADEGASPHGV